MDELTIALKAREFVSRCGPSALPVSVESYAAEIDGVALDVLGRRSRNVESLRR